MRKPNPNTKVFWTKAHRQEMSEIKEAQYDGGYYYQEELYPVPRRFEDVLLEQELMAMFPELKAVRLVREEKS